MPCPRVSIVIPTYNRASLIGQTLDSVDRQTFRDFEVIVLDDGSTDRTPDLIRARHGPVRYLRQERRGAAAARNHALAEAQGELVAFLDSDDLWLPEFLEEVVSALNDAPNAALGYSDFRTIDAAGSVLRGHRKRQHGGNVVAPLFASIFIHTSCVVARRERILEAGGFDEQLEATEDYDLWLRLSLTYPFVSVPKPLCLRRTHNGSLSRNGNVRILIRKAQLLEEFYRDHGNGAIPRDLARCRLAKTFYTAGKATARHWDFTESAGLFRRSMDYAGSARAMPWYLLSLALRGSPADRGRGGNGQEQDDHST
ncbi:MAG: glycosyltransferase [Phycisphaerae bacterium]|nr:glycosyltransferase [Phycisphaerae bacterium]